MRTDNDKSKGLYRMLVAEIGTRQEGVQVVNLLKSFCSVYFLFRFYLSSVHVHSIQTYNIK